MCALVLLARTATSSTKLEQPGVKIVKVDMSNVSEAHASVRGGASCVVSVIQGLPARRLSTPHSDPARRGDRRRRAAFYPI